METVVGRWNGLPRGLVEPPSLEAFSRRGIKGHDLVMGLGEPGWWLDLIFKGFSNLEDSAILWHISWTSAYGNHYWKPVLSSIVVPAGLRGWVTGGLWKDGPREKTERGTVNAGRKWLTTREAGSGVSQRGGDVTVSVRIFLIDPSFPWLLADSSIARLTHIEQGGSSSLTQAWCGMILTSQL